MRAPIPDDVVKALTASRWRRRQRRLDQLEISVDRLILTDDLLGKGGFGVVFKASYDGPEAAAKIVYVEHDVGVSAVEHGICTSNNLNDGNRTIVGEK